MGSAFVLAALSALACGRLLELGEEPAPPADAGANGGDGADGATIVPGCPLAVTPATLDFGGVFVGLTSTIGVTLVNASATALDVTPELTPTAGFSLETPGPVTVAPSATAKVLVRFAPTAEGQADASLAVRAEGCATVPVSLKGKGVPADGFAVSPGSLDFAGECESQPAALGLTLTAGSAGATFDAGASPPATVTPQSGNLLPGATRPFAVTLGASLPLTPGTAPAGSVWLDVTGAGTFTIPVTTTSTGAHLSLSKQLITLTSKDNLGNATLTNLGNAGVALNPKVSGVGIVVVTPPAPFFLAAKASVPITASAAIQTPRTATLSFTTITGKVCLAAPPLTITFE